MVAKDVPTPVTKAVSDKKEEKDKKDKKADDIPEETPDGKHLNYFNLREPPIAILRQYQ